MCVSYPSFEGVPLIECLYEQLLGIIMQRMCQTLGSFSGVVGYLSAVYIFMIPFDSQEKLKL